MAKHVSAIVSGAGWIAGFTDRLIEALQVRGCSNEEIHTLVTSKAKLAIDPIADAVAAVIKTAKNVFRLTKVGDGRKTEELVRAGNYNYANSYVNSTNFPVRSKPGVREIVLIEFDHDPTSEEVLAEAVKQGLERPLYEDALYFGVEHPEVQRERPVIFLHEPWRDPYGGLIVVYLWGGAGFRGLSLFYFDDGWFRYYRFAFVRK